MNQLASIMFMEVKQSPKKSKNKQSEDKIIRAIKGRVIRNIKNLFQQKAYYNPVRAGNVYSCKYKCKNKLFKYKCNSEKNIIP